MALPFPAYVYRFFFGRALLIASTGLLHLDRQAFHKHLPSGTPPHYSNRSTFNCGLRTFFQKLFAVATSSYRTYFLFSHTYPPDLHILPFVSLPSHTRPSFTPILLSLFRFGVGAGGPHWLVGGWGLLPVYASVEYFHPALRFKESCQSGLFLLQ